MTTAWATISVCACFQEAVLPGGRAQALLLTNRSALPPYRVLINNSRSTRRVTQKHHGREGSGIGLTRIVPFQSYQGGDGLSARSSVQPADAAQRSRRAASRTPRSPNGSRRSAHNRRSRADVGHSTQLPPTRAPGPLAAHFPPDRGALFAATLHVNPPGAAPPPAPPALPSGRSEQAAPGRPFVLPRSRVPSRRPREGSVGAVLGSRPPGRGGSGRAPSGGGAPGWTRRCLPGAAASSRAVTTMERRLRFPRPAEGRQGRAGAGSAAAGPHVRAAEGQRRRGPRGGAVLPSSASGGSEEWTAWRRGRESIMGKVLQRHLKGGGAGDGGTRDSPPGGGRGRLLLAARVRGAVQCGAMQCRSAVTSSERDAWGAELLLLRAEHIYVYMYICICIRAFNNSGSGQLSDGADWDEVPLGIAEVSMCWVTWRRLLRYTRAVTGRVQGLLAARLPAVWC